jgi:hypothetical protein
MIENKYRQLVFELPCLYVKGKNETSDVVLSLFSDMILISKQKKQISQLYRDPVPFESLILIDYASKGKLIKLTVEIDEKQFSIFQIGKGLYTFIAASVRDKILWLESAEFQRGEFLKIYRYRELQLFQTNQPIPLPSFDDQLLCSSDSMSSIESAASRKLTGASDPHVNTLEKVEEEDIPHFKSCSSLSKSAIRKSYISSVTKRLHR